MSAQDIGPEDFAFAPPPFNAAAALQRVQRDLKALGLVERTGTFERRGIAIARLSTDGTEINASLVKKPSRNSPEWQHRLLADHAQVTQFCALVRKQLAAWSDGDD